MKLKLLFFGIIILLVSCEGENGGDGIVFDKETGVVLDSVMYKCIETEKIKYTDSLGNWEMYGPFGGCMPDCLDFHVEFSKAGYKTITIKNPDDDIYLEVEE